MHFDPNAFLNLSITESFERRPPMPTDKLYPAQASSITPRQWTSKDKYNDDGTPKQGVAYDVEFTVYLPLDVKELCKFKTDTITLKDGIMVDLNDKGGLDTTVGRNRQLRSYRDAMNQNAPGVAWSPTMLVGPMVLLKLRHEEYPQGSGNVQEKIADVLRHP